MGKNGMHTRYEYVFRYECTFGIVNCKYVVGTLGISYGVYIWVLAMVCIFGY